MNKLEEKLVNWSELEFNLKLNAKDINSLLRTKNGLILQKLFEFMISRVKSKKNGDIIMVCSHIIECNSQIDETRQQINSIETITSQLYSILSNQQNKRNIVAHLQRRDQYNINIINLLSKITEKIAVKSKLCANLSINDQIINDVMLSYKNLVSINEQTSSNTNTTSLHQILPQTNITFNEISEVIDAINLHLFEIKNITINNISGNVMFDKQNMLTILSDVHRNQIDLNVKASIKVMDVKSSKHTKIDATKLCLEKALLKYSEIREKHNRFKHKLLKVIDLCDAFIQDKRSKC